ncbi:MAG TPA: hypothetical protein VK589_10415 [Chryseolinea sp.]|nr:hypothetical protein [Chryseolinea sp.]
MKAICISILFSLSVASFAQDTKELVITEDAKYFDFWVGTWHVINENGTIDSTSYFKIKRSVHSAAFEEEWQLAVDKTKPLKSVALRAWDKSNNKWGFVWVSDNGLYQIWDSRKVDGHWYIYKQFTVNGDTYLSRQGFLLQPDDTVLRISEKTYDEKKWEVRFKQRLKKVK